MFIRQSQIKPDCSLLSSSLKTRSTHRDFWGKKLHWMKADVAQIHEAITSLRKTTCFGAQMDARYSSQGADVVSVFHIFPLDLFVCWNWREAFRVSSRLSQDKTKMQGERPGSESLFQSLKPNIYWNTKQSGFAALSCTWPCYSIYTTFHIVCMMRSRFLLERKSLDGNVFLLRHEPTFMHIRALTTRCQAVEFSCFPMWLKSRYVLSKGNFSLKNSGLCFFYCWWQSPNSIFGHSSSLWRFKAFKETSANAKMTLLAENWSGLTPWGYRPSLTRVSDPPRSAIRQIRARRQSRNLWQSGTRRTKGSWSHRRGRTSQRSLNNQLTVIHEESEEEDAADRHGWELLGDGHSNRSGDQPLKVCSSRCKRGLSK